MSFEEPGLAIIFHAATKENDPEQEIVYTQEMRQTMENRWCDRWGYFIDLAACEARADRRKSCGRCLSRWRQCCFPFYENP
ncbi:MAG: hypothetical protein CSYNP_02435 [Syntrophus sp. SKADARSKE-3]|nr:hypothetical protein [Syntrophus sp. SKADARSKE-3]